MMSLRRNIIAGWCPSLGPTAGTLFDRFAANNHGTLNNMALSSCWVMNGGKRELDLDGVNDFVNVPDSGSLKPSLISFSLWCRPRTTNQAAFSTIAGKCWTTTHASPFFSWKFGANFSSNPSGPYSFEFNVAGTLYGITASFGPSAGRLDFLCGTFDGATARFFVNGMLESSANYAGTISYSNGPFRIGANANGAELFNGSVDDAQVRSQALSSSEIAQLYRLGRGGIYQPQRRTRYASVRRFRKLQYAQLVGGGIV